MKINIINDNVEFSEISDKTEIVVFTYPKEFFCKLLSKQELEETSKSLKLSAKDTIISEKPLEYFEDIIIDTIEKCLIEKAKNVESNSIRLKALLVYHMKTLTSIKNLDSKEKVDAYIDNELYNLAHITIDQLYDLLNSVTNKKK